MEYICLRNFLVQKLRDFAALAGVRDRSEVRTRFPKGLPSDGIDSNLQYHMDTTDAHSKSWATVEEWRNAVDPFKSEYTYEYHMVTRLLESLEQDGYEARVIYWFDN